MAAPSSNIRTTACAAIPSTAASVGPIEPDKRWGASLGGPIIRDRLFFFGAYEHQEAGAVAGRGSDRRRLPERGRRGLDRAVQRRSPRSSAASTASTPVRRSTSRPFENDRWFARLDWQITEDHRLELTYQHLEESTRPHRRLLHRHDAAGHRPQHLLHQRHRVRLLFGPPLLAVERQFLDRGPLFALGDPGPSGSGRRRRGAVGQSDPAHHRRHRQSRPESTRPFSPARARRARPTICRPRSSCSARSPIYDGGDHQLKVGVEINHADIFNLFVQNATGTLVFRNVADLRSGPAVAGPRQQPDQHPAGQRHQWPHRRSVRQRLFDRRHQRCRRGFHPHHLFGLRAGRLAGHRSAERHRWHPFDWFSGGNPDLNHNFLNRYGIPNNTGFDDIGAVFLPRLAFTYDFDDFSIFSRGQLRGGVGMFSGGDPLVWFGNAFQNDGSGFAPWARPRPPLAPPARSTW